MIIESEYDFGPQFKKLHEALQKAEEGAKTSEIAQVLDSFAKLYQSAVERDNIGYIPTKRNDKLLPLLDAALERFLDSSFPKK